jgi:hypothetical protein
MSTLRKFVEDQIARLEALIVLELQSRIQYQDMCIKLAMEEHDARQARRTRLFEKLLVLLPVLLRRFLGGGASQDKLLGEEQLGELLESFTEEQVKALVGLLTDVQRVSFISVYQMYRDRKRDSSGASEDEPPPVSNRESTAPPAEQVA